MTRQIRQIAIIIHRRRQSARERKPVKIRSFILIISGLNSNSLTGTNTEQHFINWTWKSSKKSSSNLRWKGRRQHTLLGIVYRWQRGKKIRFHKFTEWAYYTHKIWEKRQYNISSKLDIVQSIQLTCLTIPLKDSKAFGEAAPGAAMT